MKTYLALTFLFLFLCVADVSAQTAVSVTTSGNPVGIFTVTIRGAGSSQATTAASLLVVNGNITGTTTNLEFVEVSSVEVLDSQDSLVLYGVPNAVVITTLDEVAFF